MALSQFSTPQQHGNDNSVALAVPVSLVRHSGCADPLERSYLLIPFHLRRYDVPLVFRAHAVSPILESRLATERGLLLTALPKKRTGEEQW
jgi:hypothetical protein